MGNNPSPDKAHRTVLHSQHRLSTCFLCRETCFLLAEYQSLHLLHFVSQWLSLSQGMHEWSLLIFSLLEEITQDRGNGRAMSFYGHHGLGSSSDYFPRGNVRIWEKFWRMCSAPPTWRCALYCQTRMLFYHGKDSFLPESFCKTPMQIKSFPSVLPCSKYMIIL